MSEALPIASQQQQPIDPALIERVIVHGDLSGLNPQQKTEYYMRVCESVGLNPYTKPFEYMKLSGKEVLYAKRDATDQLRKLHNISAKLLPGRTIEGVFVITAQVNTPSGRTDESSGAVNIKGLTGDPLANAIMKAETKAKRRATLSICGLGMLDETELETIPQERKARIEEPPPAQLVESRANEEPSQQLSATELVKQQLLARIHYLCQEHQVPEKLWPMVVEGMRGKAPKDIGSVIERVLALNG